MLVVWVALYVTLDCLTNGADNREHPPWWRCQHSKGAISRSEHPRARLLKQSKAIGRAGARAVDLPARCSATTDPPTPSMRIMMPLTQSVTETC